MCDSSSIGVSARSWLRGHRWQKRGGPQKPAAAETPELHVGGCLVDGSDLRHATIDEEFYATDPTAVVRGKEGHSLCNIVGQAGATQGDL